MGRWFRWLFDIPAWRVRSASPNSVVSVRIARKRSGESVLGEFQYSNGLTPIKYSGSMWTDPFFFLCFLFLRMCCE
jgi:hypothetical protein